MWLGSCVAVAVVEASGYSSDSTPSLGTSPYATGVALKRKKDGVPVVAQWLTNPTRNHEVVGLIPGLAKWG